MRLSLGFLCCILAFACACDSDDETRAGLDEFDGPYVAVWRETAGGLCDRISVIESNGDVWDGHACESAMAMRRVAHASKAQLAAATSAFDALDDVADPLNCDAFFARGAGTRVGLHQKTGSAVQFHEVCTDDATGAPSPWAEAIRAVEDLL